MPAKYQKFSDIIDPELLCKPRRKFRPNTNADRADRAEEALLAYVRDERMDACHFYDFLCDYMHLCDRENLDFNQLVERGRRLYEDER